VKPLLYATILVLVAAAVQAHEIKIGNLVIVHPMVDEADKGQAGALGSVEIRNEGTATDKLLSISSEFADKVTVEAPLPVIVPANGRVSVPLVFHNIKRKLSAYEAYAGQLVLEKAGGIQIDLMVHSQPH
jgi:copper(I)-binding protein